MPLGAGPPGAPSSPLLCHCDPGAATRGGALAACVQVPDKALCGDEPPRCLLGVTRGPSAGQVQGGPGSGRGGGTLSFVRLLFLVGLGGGRSTCRSAKVGSPGFTTVTSSSSGMLVSCGDTESCSDLPAVSVPCHTPGPPGTPPLPSWPVQVLVIPDPGMPGGWPRHPTVFVSISCSPALLAPQPFPRRQPLLDQACPPPHLT